ncbi:hypothetical protein [Cysteiniphilum sp. 6C5]|uniref:hypothetical protein n=1 Tax=unclassified Cysteiniphilum TaxID=2610889 RepID=UPI003F874D30
METERLNQDVCLIFDRERGKFWRGNRSGYSYFDAYDTGLFDHEFADEHCVAIGSEQQNIKLIPFFFRLNNPYSFMIQYVTIFATNAEQANDVLRLFGYDRHLYYLHHAHEVFSSVKELLDNENDCSECVHILTPPIEYLYKD